MGKGQRMGGGKGGVHERWGIVGKELYLLDVLRRRMEYPALKGAVRDQYALCRPSVVLIEDKASGTQLIQELVADGLHASPATSRIRTRSCALGVAKGNACRVRRSFASPRACTRRRQ
jgi:hypothetical protein